MRRAIFALAFCAPLSLGLLLSTCVTRPPAATQQPHPVAGCPPCDPPRPAPPALPKHESCVFGHVQARGEMPLEIRNASVTVATAARDLGSVNTDDSGHYVWCAPTALTGPASLMVRVDKPPFVSVKAGGTLRRGQHLQLDFEMVAPGLND